MKSRLAWRKFVNAFMLSLTGLCALVSVSVLLVVLGYLGWNGWQYLTLSFLIHLPADQGSYLL